MVDNPNNEGRRPIEEPLFQFTSFTDWKNNAQRRFRNAGVTHADVICFDAKDRWCPCGRQFRRAEEEGTYPIKAYRKPSTEGQVPRG